MHEAAGGHPACCKYNAGRGIPYEESPICEGHAAQLDGLLAYLQRYKGQYLVLNSGYRVDIPEGA